MVEPFILYACPVGELADQLQAYFVESEQRCGRNAAHNYMPHCTLTGFFRDEETSIGVYEAAIAQALEEQLAIALPRITVQQMSFRPDWYGLEIESPWLQQFTVLVAQYADSPTRQEPLRLKSWLHLSLAYEFQPESAATLKQLAVQHINPQAPVAWEIRFYQRHPNHRWTCHHNWPLPILPRDPG